MKNKSFLLIIFTSSLSVCAVNFTFFAPAKASVVCESNTISTYANGSLSTCILGQNTTVQVSSSGSGTSIFYCQEQKYISFDEKGQFHSCQLSQEIEIRQNNSIKICPVGHKVYVDISENGIQSINCRDY
ncbi:hypothetical protein [Nostoc sp. TCL26-01]|uniref:hypothetical protein n=1 Tax=Nostoc sp. TCL26-01 TaxID=2576904 RepID=UPI0015BEC94D|nr:hypothetical protein [Nostoc sp. TCL26-01]QLE54595.1 hypothetical protein FD725_03145 [Nostoc sp. TCL26-01]